MFVNFTYVPGTGQLIVGAWNPKSINLFAISTASTFAVFLNSRISRINSCATKFDAGSLYKVL